MIEKEFVIEFLFKEKMLLKSFKILKPYLIKEYKSKEKTNNEFRSSTLESAINCIKSIEKNGTFNYYDAFVLSLVFSKEFLDVKNLIMSEKMDLSENFQREDYWRNEDIHFNEALYFSYTFLNETYKKQLSIDLKKLSEKIDKYSFTKSNSLATSLFFKKLKEIKKEENLV